MITVEDGGFITTVQDMGRHGYRSLGMPLGGAIDRFSSGLANLLVGNRSEAALLEMTLRGASYSFSRDALVSITGADMSACLNGENLRNWSSFIVSSGSLLTFGPAKTGLRSYLAVRGGLDVTPFLGSRSTCLAGKAGGHEGRALRKGDTFISGADQGGKGRVITLPERCIPEYGDEAILRALPGPREDAFTDRALIHFFRHPYRILPESDRMGYRLQGPPLELKGSPDIVSEPMTPGSVQVPGNGQPILLLADAQTTGGYNRIATVLSADLSRAAQGRPGGSIRFKVVSEEEAIDSMAGERDILREITDYINSGT